MTKLYYKDPIHAAYMQREFNVKVDGHNTLDIVFGDFFDGYPYDVESDGEPYYIHPDSYEIFEPKEGDDVDYDYKGRGERFIERLIDDDESCDFSRFFNGTHDDIRIIQRNGKAFIMPEREE